jgi:phage tail sheath gpL-like
MTITFDQFPANLRVPGVFVEVGGASTPVTGTQPYRLGLIGQLLSTGTVEANTPTRVTRAADAQVLFGAGSMLAAMAAAALANGRFVEVYAIGMDDPDTGAAQAAGALDVSVTTARAGTIPVYIGGVRVPVAVTAGSTADTIAANIASRINARTDLPVTASATGASCALTAKHAGAVGNRIPVAVAALDGELLPTGVTVDVTAMAAGSGTPDIAAALTAMGDDHYNVVALGYEDAPAVTATITEMESRADATRQLGGVAVTASTGNLAAVKAITASLNSERMVVVGAVSSPSSPWDWAAAVGALIAKDAQEDPAKPFTTADLSGLMVAGSAARPTDVERNDLLHNGVATVVRGGSGAPAIERLITTYQTNDLGAEDITFLDVQAVLILERLRFEMRGLGSKFARFKVADDGTAFGVGQEVLTPNALKGEIVALYAGWVEQGWVESSDEFAASLIVERDAGDPTRLNVSMNPDIVNALRILGVRISLTL